MPAAEKWRASSFHVRYPKHRRNYDTSGHRCEHTNTAAPSRTGRHSLCPPVSGDHNTHQIKAHALRPLPHVQIEDLLATGWKPEPDDE